MASRDLDQLQKILKCRFHDENLLRRALTHASADATANYERLEFLGDRVLGLVIAESLYERFPQESEGDLAKRLAALAQGELLAAVANNMGLGDYIDLSAAERGAGGANNNNILSDVFEALIGALYIDQGYPPCRKLIEHYWAGRFDEMVQPPQHPKTALQEWAQAKGLALPVYNVAGQKGPDHAPIFEVRLTVSGYPDVIASGRSRQAAEKEAAAQFLSQYEKFT
ncbi:MAG: ribonuclease III [Alphaproteobacteria bacterium]|nr:ribonuclease III [Alphaproteobacteria bacterium]